MNPLAELYNNSLRLTLTQYKDLHGLLMLIQPFIPKTNNFAFKVYLYADKGYNIKCPRRILCKKTLKE